MIWAKREFKHAEWAPYQDRFADLHLKLRGPAGMMMVMAEKRPGLSDVIISLPDANLLPMFDGFEVISESDLPKDASLLYGTDDFERRFSIPNRRTNRRR